MRRSAHVLLEGAPAWLDRDAMQQHLVANVAGVAEVHHVHVWGLTPQQLLATMHLTLAQNAPPQRQVLRDAKRFLKQEYGIGHATIEIDVDGCTND